MTREVWTLDQVADYLQTARKSADKQLRRWGVEAVGRQPGRAGQNLYAAAAVRRAHAARPGQGARTDIR